MSPAPLCAPCSQNTTSNRRTRHPAEGSMTYRDAMTGSERNMGSADQLNLPGASDMK